MAKWILFVLLIAAAIACIGFVLLPAKDRSEIIAAFIISIFGAGGFTGLLQAFGIDLFKKKEKNPLKETSDC